MTAIPDKVAEKETMRAVVMKYLTSLRQREGQMLEWDEALYFSISRHVQTVLERDIGRKPANNYFLEWCDYGFNA